MGNVTAKTSGEIATFMTPAKTNIKSLKVHFSPKQDLHGYTKPWVGGGGKNLCPDLAHMTSTMPYPNIIYEYNPDTYTWKIIDDIGGDGQTWRQARFFFDASAMAGKRVCLSYQSFTRHFGDVDSQVGRSTVAFSVGGVSVWVSPEYNKKWIDIPSDVDLTNAEIGFRLVQENGELLTKGCYIEVVGLQIEVGDTGTDFEPYENICPIDGWDGVEVNYGKNLFDYSHDEIKYNYYRDNNGDEVYSATSFYTITSYPIQPNCKIFLHNDNDVFAVRIYFLTQDDQWISRTNWLSSTSKIITLDQRGIPSNCKKIQLHFTTSNPPVLNTFTLLVINNISYQWKLPDEYQEVEYIESTGTQYIDTGIVANLETSWDVDFSDFDNNENTYAGFGGQYDSTKKSIINIGKNRNTTSVYCSFGNQYDKINYITDGWTTRLTFHIDKNGVKENGVVKGTFSDTITFDEIDTLTLTLFARNSDGIIGRFAKMKLYSSVIKNNETVVSNLIPCYRKSDNEIGMYDTVSQTFYTNQGTGTFLKGEDVDKTFYGGYVDLISGELVEEYSEYILSNTTNVFKDLENGYYEIGFGNLDGDGYGDAIKNICNILPYGFKTSTSPPQIGFTADYVLSNKANRFHAVIYSNTELTESTVRQWLIDNNFQLVRKIKTPITHQLTPTQLKSFVGQNNFWSNADYVEVEYDLIETIDIQKCRKKIILNQPQLKTISDKVVSFNTDMVAPMKNCKIYFNPIQLGSGDPSPTND